METLDKVKKAILGHEKVELADILQAALLVIFVLLLLFIALKVKLII